MDNVILNQNVHFKCSFSFDLCDGLRRVYSRLEQWFPTAGPRTGAGPRKFFAGPRSILFSSKIILIWNHNHCKGVTLCKTHFTPGRFAAVKLTYLAFHC